MKDKIHPKYEQIEVKCACGNKFATRSTSKKIGSIEIHPCLGAARCRRITRYHVAETEFADSGPEEAATIAA